MMKKDQISALMDGELDDDEARIVVGKFKQDATDATDATNATARAEWEIYHLIGDTLRQTPLWEDGFSARFAEKLAAEPTVLAPHRRPALRRPVIALSAAASLAAVSLVAWTAFQLNQPGTDTATDTANSANRVVAAEVPHDVNHYLIAHQEYSATPIGTSTAIRSATPYPNTSQNLK